MEVQFFHASLSVGVLIFIMAGGFLAGFVDSIAGGGGLVSLPVLMLPACRLIWLWGPISFGNLWRRHERLAIL